MDEFINGPAFKVDGVAYATFRGEPLPRSFNALTRCEVVGVNVEVRIGFSFIVVIALFEDLDISICGFIAAIIDCSERIAAGFKIFWDSNFGIDIAFFSGVSVTQYLIANSQLDVVVWSRASTVNRDVVA